MGRDPGGASISDRCVVIPPRQRYAGGRLRRAPARARWSRAAMRPRHYLGGARVLSLRRLAARWPAISRGLRLLVIVALVIPAALSAPMPAHAATFTVTITTD